MQDAGSAPNLGPAHKATLVESVIEQIIALIREGQFQPGDKLPSERTLMSSLEVGRSTVREALQALAAMNLIETRSGHGSYVKSIPPVVLEPGIGSSAAALEKDLRLQLLDVREVVETAAATWAVEQATEEDLATISEHLEAYLAFVAAGDWDRQALSHRAFHTAIASASGNSIAARVVTSLVSTIPSALSRRYRRYWQEEMKIHRQIFAALENRDARAMRVAIKVHMDEERKQITSH